MCRREKDWRCQPQVAPARSLWRAHVACVPRVRRRQSFSRTVLSQKPKSVRIISPAVTSICFRMAIQTWISDAIDRDFIAFHDFLNVRADLTKASIDAGRLRAPLQTQTCHQVPKVWTHLQKHKAFACAKRLGAAARGERRRRERWALLAVRGRRASRSDTRAASQAFERVHNALGHRSKT